MDFFLALATLSSIRQMMSTSLLPLVKSLLTVNCMRFSSLVRVAVLRWDQRPSKA